MTDVQPPYPAPPVAPYPAPGAVGAKPGMPVWGIVVIAGAALAVGLIAFVIILGLTALGRGAAPAGSEGPGVTQPGGEQPEAGVGYRSDEAGYEVTFPGEPTESSLSQRVLGYDLETFTVTWVSGARNVSTNATAFPDELYAGDAIESMLTGSLDGGAEAIGGTIERSEFIDFEGERAVTALITTSDTEIYMLVVFHNQVQYSIASVNGTQEEHDEVVASFRFVD
jgi:hypothetical protein